jgi:hypothetical protein
MVSKKPKKTGRNARIRAVANSFTLTDPVVTVPKAPPVSTRYPFIASDGNANFFRAAQLKDVCRSSELKPSCIVGKSKVGSKKLGLRAPSLREYTAACKKAGGTMTKGYNKPIRADKVELDFLSPAQAKKFKTLPGPNLRLCVRDDKAGYIVPVSDPSEAQRIANDFAKCTNGDKKRMPMCALQLAKKETGKKNPPLGLLGNLNRGGLLGGLFTRG